MSPTPHARDRLIAAAWEVLARSGYEGFKVASVIRKAGVSTTTFYRCFDNKEELFIELLRDEAQRGATRISNLVGVEDDPEQRVRAWIDATTSAATVPELHARTALFSEAAQQRLGSPGALAEMRRELIAPLVEAIEDGVRTGRFTSTDPVGDATRIHAMCRAAVIDIVAGSVAPNGAIAGIADFALRAIAAR